MPRPDSWDNWSEHLTFRAEAPEAWSWPGHHQPPLRPHEESVGKVVMGTLVLLSASRAGLMGMTAQEPSPQTHPKSRLSLTWGC